MKATRKIIEIDEELCNGCGQCVPDCVEGSLKIVNGKAKLIAENLCDGLGACLGSCPTGALKIIERTADAFDEHAVEKHLAENQQPETVAPPVSGCPSSKLHTFPAAGAPSSCKSANLPKQVEMGNNSESALSHWPVQIRLIPPHAPFLQDADLLVVADCTAVALPNIQANYMQGKVVMMGCPKFDDAESYIQRFSEIIANCNLKA
jgi:NAD-dependent dihydropyrimidine dehydrogenase PreA subunit